MLLGHKTLCYRGGNDRQNGNPINEGMIKALNAFLLDKNVAKACERVLMRAQHMHSHQVSQ